MLQIWFGLGFTSLSFVNPRVTSGCSVYVNNFEIYEKI